MPAREPTTWFFGISDSLEQTLHHSANALLHSAWSEYVVDTGRRPYALPGGRIAYRWLPWCTCPTPQGPAGGVCGCCGHAIPASRTASEEPSPCKSAP